jgi:hypothetical protein
MGMQITIAMNGKQYGSLSKKENTIKSNSTSTGYVLKLNYCINEVTVLSCLL